MRAWFAIVPNLNEEQVTITANVAKLIESISQYNVIDSNKNSKQEENKFHIVITFFLRMVPNLS